MTERRGGRPTPPSERESNRWDTEAIADALGVPTESRVDQLHGQGVRFRLGQPPGTELELFPTSRTVRVTSEDMQLSLFRQEPPQLAEEGVVFELPGRASRRWLSVSPDGAATLFYQPTTTSDVTESPPQPPNTVEYPNSLRPDNEGISDDSAAPQTDATTASPSPESSPAAGPAPDKPAYIKRLTGRLGGKPRFHQTRAGRLVGEFDLAVKDPDDPEKATWHRVALFGERAMHLQENGLQKGDVVDIIGAYRHVREYTGKDGKPRRKEELRPTLVKRR